MNKMTIPNGYRIVETKKHLAIDDAVSVLSGRAQTHITFAKRNDDDAEIVSHQIVCPHCRGTLPACGRFLHEIFHTHDRLPFKISRNAVEAWGGAQACLWEGEADTLVFNPVYSPHGTYTCPHCLQKSEWSKGSTNVTISVNHRKVRISCECTNIGDIFRLPWKVKSITHMAFPFRESITFNFATGKTYISISDNQGHIFAVRNISAPDDWACTKIFQLLQQNTLVRRWLKQCFQEQWRANLPVAERDLTPALFVKLTSFIGYSAEFFDRLPIAEGHYLVEKSFRRIAKRVHTPKQLCDEIARSRLSQSKSLRKMLYSTPDLVFYLAEIELLGKWFCDVNVLRTLLRSPFTYPLLSFLHVYQSANLDAFFTDFIQQKGTRALTERLWKKHEEVLIYALHYSGLSPDCRKAERQKWAVDKHIPCLPALPHALPMRSTSIPDSQLDGFVFHQLRSKAEYLTASKALRNCLSKWSEHDNPVIVIRYKSSILGAIEIEGQNRIVQAKGKHNLSLPESCLPAYEKWKEKFHLTEVPHRLWEDDEEEYNPRMFRYLNCRWF